MLTIRRKISILIVILAIGTGSFFYFFNKMNYSRGKAEKEQVFVLEKGDNALEVGKKLKQNGIIANEFYFVAYLWKEKQLHSLIAAKYEIAPNLTIPELAKLLTGVTVQDNRVKLTFPEGWTAKQMAKRISDSGFSGEEFLIIEKNPSKELKGQFEFLADLKDGSTLEGYLFPDTYFFAKDATAQDIVNKMLKNFDSKLTSAMRSEIKNQQKSLAQIVTMASIVQGEVQTVDDMNTVSGIFWNRLRINQRLQSDATLEYVLGTNKKQHSLMEIQFDSPYNTYRVAGLPPGPVNNPGIEAISAAIYPTTSEYFYFLTDLKTGKTIFSKTFDEHVQNKTKFGL